MTQLKIYIPAIVLLIVGINIAYIPFTINFGDEDTEGLVRFLFLAVGIVIVLISVGLAARVMLCRLLSLVILYIGFVVNLFSSLFFYLLSGNSINGDLTLSLKLHFAYNFPLILCAALIWFLSSREVREVFKSYK